MKTNVLRVLNAEAKAWPYYVNNRAKQRQAIRDSLETVRHILATQDAYQSLGKGENHVHYEKVQPWDGSYSQCSYSQCSYSQCSYSGYSDRVADLYVSLGVPTIDYRPAPFGEIAKVVISGPMIAVGHQKADDKPHALAYRPLREVAALCKTAGCDIHNL